VLQEIQYIRPQDQRLRKEIDFDPQEAVNGGHLAMVSNPEFVIRNLGEVNDPGARSQCSRYILRPKEH
jgi:hypothetical protein